MKPLPQERGFLMPPVRERGFLMIEALVALAIAALMAALVFDSVWQMGRTAAAAADRRQALLLARSVLAAASVPGTSTPIPARGADGRLAWSIASEAFSGEAADGIPLETINVAVSDAASGRVLARLTSLKARQ
ncbi:prepilin-type N-terminal cleavage/methylation domain-containing protein [Novosphingobium sp. PASSN1]|uniref:prepilin-type N-terminal cleavage/methylation domain-containing protein n=1 Tax=Novosphingobium sp. PASSN1 TaxID=2015561 RepID=UPI0025DF1410|nr:prepilin-type N-terminal cleavage/methylation domain-containing protein [Novosphingobium sp. PASSN1]